MKKTNKKLLSFLVVVLAFAFVASFAFAKNDNKGKEKSESKNKSEKVKELKDFEKPTKNKTNAQIHKDKTNEVADSLKSVGKENKIQGKSLKEVSEEEDLMEEEVVEEAEEIAGEVTENSEDAAEAIEAVEKENKFKKFLVGTDYKNLGQLRSSLAHNENQIRKLTKLSEKVQIQEMEQDMGVESEIENQLVVLMQERERIKTVLQEGQESFSILGWFGKLFGTKTEVEVDEEKEDQIEEEVLEVLEEEDEEVEDENKDEGGEEMEEETAEETEVIEETPTE